MLRSVLPTLRAAAPRRVAHVRFASSKINELKNPYTATSYTIGSRAAGTTYTAQGTEAKIDLPKELGGAGKYENPESLFGSAFSGCFLSALGAANGKLPKDARVDAAVSIGQDASEKQPGFLLSVELKIASAPLKKDGLSDEQIKEIVKKAGGLCPYSRALKGNVDIVYTIV